MSGPISGGLKEWHQLFYTLKHGEGNGGTPQ